MGSFSGAVCSPSRHMIMSGRTVWRLPVAPGQRDCPPDLEENTIGAVFNRAGYATMRTCKQGNSYPPRTSSSALSTMPPGAAAHMKPAAPGTPTACSTTSASASTRDATPVLHLLRPLPSPRRPRRHAGAAGEIRCRQPQGCLLRSARPSRAAASARRTGCPPIRLTTPT
jgi:hypothetical protein